MGALSGQGDGQGVFWVLSGQGGGDPPPQAATQAVLDPALLPLLHGRGFVGGAQHGDAAAPGGGTRTHGLAPAPSTLPSLRMAT